MSAEANPSPNHTPAEAPEHTSTDKAGTPERVSAEANPSPKHASDGTSEHTSAEAPKRTPEHASAGKTDASNHASIGKTNASDGTPAPAKIGP